ncbi:hypothetical protein AFLA_010170 [Aspergillus flavus NRRL3357]|nr:hypothetical protein AFLA_010170 [Aspergillus flavus NRRL3357]
MGRYYIFPLDNNLTQTCSGIGKIRVIGKEKVRSFSLRKSTRISVDINRFSCARLLRPPFDPSLEYSDCLGSGGAVESTACILPPPTPPPRHWLALALRPM